MSRCQEHLACHRLVRDKIRRSVIFRKSGTGIHHCRKSFTTELRGDGLDDLALQNLRSPAEKVS